MNESTRQWRRWALHKVNTIGTGTSGAPGVPCGDTKDEGKVCGQPFDLEHVLRHGEGNKNCRSLERVAHDVPVPASAGRPQVQVQRLQGNRGSRASFGPVRFCRTKMEASQKANISRWKHARTSWRDGSMH